MPRFRLTGTMGADIVDDRTLNNARELSDHLYQQANAYLTTELKLHLLNRIKKHIGPQLAQFVINELEDELSHVFIRQDVTARIDRRETKELPETKLLSPPDDENVENVENDATGDLE